MKRQAMLIRRDGFIGWTEVETSVHDKLKPDSTTIEWTFVHSSARAVFEPKSEPEPFLNSDRTFFTWIDIRPSFSFFIFVQGGA